MGSIFDILGPVMVGPSSSHTAGAARIGYTARQLFHGLERKVYLHGSFAATGKGHGPSGDTYPRTSWDEAGRPRIPVAFEEAKKAGMEFTISNKELKKYHSEYSQSGHGE